MNLPFESTYANRTSTYLHCKSKRLMPGPTLLSLSCSMLPTTSLYIYGYMLNLLRGGSHGKNNYRGLEPRVGLF